MATRRHKGNPRKFEYRGGLQPPPGFDQLISVSVDLSGPVALWAGAADEGEILDRAQNSGGASFPAARTSTGPQVALAAYTPGSRTPSHLTTMGALPVAHPLVQSLPDGGFLVVGARCGWRDEGPERNALVVEPDGTTRAEGTLGDGIAHMMIDASGTIWTGYFDEGIFGDLGWGGPGTQPLGAAGIVRWSLDFEKTWEYRPVLDYRLADCYTLNVSGDEVWACPYTDFPVLQIKDDLTTLHPTKGVDGPTGLLVAGDLVAFMGAYGDGGSFLLGSLGDGLLNLQRGELVMPDGQPVPRRSIICRGSLAHLFVGADWFTFDLAASL